MPDGQLPEQAESMADRTLLAVIGQFEQESYGFASGELQAQRAYAIERYLGLPFGDEVDGRSSVVSTDLRDTVEWLLPQVLRVFLSGDEVVKFQASGPEDEKAAKLETEYINYVILERNDAFNVFSTWFRDALISKVGYVKAYWQERTDIKLERYKGITDDQLMIVSQDPSVQITKQQDYPDPYAPPPQPQQPGMPMQPPAPPAMLHDVEVRRVFPCGHVKIDNVPPEEIYVHQSLRTIGLDECMFLQHRTRKTISELRQDGYDVDDDIALTAGSDQGEMTDEIAISRDRFNDQSWLESDNSVDPTNRRVWVRESYLRVDYDGDGVAELRKVCHIGQTILSNEETDLIPFAAVTPIVFPHRHVGIGYDDLTRMQGEVSTAILRQFLDNLYLANNGRYVVNVANVNVDDLLVSRPGGVVRTTGVPGNDVMPLIHPQVGAQALEGLQMVQQWREASTGVSADQSNMSADVLQKATATSISQAVSSGQSRVEAVTRSFAAGVKDLFQIVHALTLKNATSDEKVKLNNEWQAVDPREWVKRTNMQIVVGLGSGTKESRIAMLMQLAQLQEQGLQAGIVRPPNLYHTGTRITQEMGYKNDEEFWTDPSKSPPPPPNKDPAVQVEELRQQGKQQEIQAATQADVQKFQAQIMAKRDESQQAMALQASNDQRQSALDQQKMQLEVMKMEKEFEFKKWLAAFEVGSEAELKRQEMEHQARLKQAELAHSAQSEQQRMAFEGQRHQTERQDKQQAQHVEKTKHAESLAPIIAKLDETIKSVTAPRTVVRGPDGRVTHVVPGK